ncbi:MAG: hypothetical protein H7X89_03265 [Rhizobiales bacterium]|nr:hypothetical protein [Hyphomicrobiales bacterium]
MEKVACGAACGATQAFSANGKFKSRLPDIGGRHQNIGEGHAVAPNIVDHRMVGNGAGVDEIERAFLEQGFRRIEDQKNAG